MPICEDYFDGGDYPGICQLVDFKNSKKFIVHDRDYNECTMIWLQLFGSKFEAQNYKYSVKVMGESYESFDHKS